MPNQLQHINSIHTRYSAPEDMREELEAHGLAVDQQRVGKLAVLSELAAETETATPHTAQSEIINPISSKDLKPRKTFNEEGRTVKEVPRHLEEIDDVLSQEQAQIHELSADPTDIKQALQQSTVSLRNLIRGTRNRPNNIDTILSGSKLSPFLRAQAEQDGDWLSWFDTATDDQVTNFAQAYNAEATKILNPEQRKAEVSALKEDMQEKVDQAVEDGWIDRGHKRKTHRAIRRSEVLFFSPFSPFAERAAGMNFEGAIARRMVILPVAVGEHIATHEFSHRIQGIDMLKLFKHVRGSFTPEERDSEEMAIGLAELTTILNEGVTEHMAVALQHGSPEIIDPEKRADVLGEAAERDTAGPYKPFREILSGILRADQDPPLSNTELCALTTSVIERDMRSFAELVTARWDGKDKITELVRVALNYAENAKKSGPQNISGFISALKECLNIKPVPDEVAKAA